MTPHRILIINVSRIGDTLLSTPAMKAIAANYPQATITCLAHPKRAEILQHLPFLHRIQTISKTSATFKGWSQIILGKYYDLAFVWGFDQPLVTYALRVSKHVVAFRQDDALTNQKLFHVVEPPPFQSDHTVNLSMTLPAALGISIYDRRLSYFVTLNERHWAEQELLDSLPPVASPLIGLQIASFHTKAYRDWPLENFIHLCKQLSTKHSGAYFLIFGGKMEQQRAAKLHRSIPTTSTLYTGRLSLRQTAALMSQLDLYIGVDTGPTHIMSSFDIPLVGLYHGSARSDLIGPLDHPCFFPVDHPSASDECSIDVSMSEISVDQVMQQVELALEVGQ